MSNTEHERKVKGRYSLPGRFLSLFEDGLHPSKPFFSQINGRDLEGTSVTFTVYNLTRDQEIYHVGADGFVSINRITQHVVVSDEARRRLLGEDYHTAHDEIANFNCEQGVLIKVTHSSNSYQSPMHLRPLFPTFSYDKLRSEPNCIVGVLDYYIHIPLSEFHNDPSGCFIPHIGQTFGLYRNKLENKVLAHSELINMSASAPSGWFFTMDSSKLGHKRLWLKMNDHFEEVISSGRDKGNTTETISVYRIVCGQIECVAVSSIDRALSEGITFECGGQIYKVPFFTNEADALAYIKKEKKSATAHLYQEIYDLKDKLQKMEIRARKAETKIVEQKESIWTRIINFFSSTIPGIIKLVPIFL